MSLQIYRNKFNYLKFWNLVKSGNDKSDNFLNKFYLMYKFKKNNLSDLIKIVIIFLWVKGHRIFHLKFFVIFALIISYWWVMLEIRAQIRNNISINNLAVGVMSYVFRLRAWESSMFCFSSLLYFSTESSWY